MNFDERGKFAKGNQISIGHGRPRGSLSITDEVRKALSQKVDSGKYDEKGKQIKVKMIELVVMQVIKKALEGDSIIIKELWEQIDGKPKQQIDLEAQVNVNIERYKEIWTGIVKKKK